MDITIKTKEIYSLLNAERKGNVRERIRLKYNISTDTAKNWISNRITPKEYQGDVYKIIREEAKRQANQLIDIAQ